MIKYADVAVIGGGPAGMSAAAAARKAGADKVVLLERDDRLGGILQQCIHSGFGLHRFGEELTGPEYGERYEKITADLGVEVMTETAVTDVRGDRTLICVNPKGCFEIKAKAVVLAMGCRERPRGALNLAGGRPAGIITAGTAQKFVNVMGYIPGKKIVILGSGDIGLIMARRMTLEGAEVKAVCEIMKDSGGLTRNIVQCLKDFDIPLKLRHTVTEVHGRERVEGVTVSEVDEKLRPIAGTEEYIECDTLMLSVGLIPENELSKKAGIKIDPATKGPLIDENKETTAEGIFACGNVVKVHELADFVSEEGERAGTAAACRALGIKMDFEIKEETFKSEKKGTVNLISGGEPAVICAGCPMGCKVKIKKNGNNFSDFITEGNGCGRGKKYAFQEMTAPKRILTTTMRAEDGTAVPVKTDGPVPKAKLFDFMKIINEKTLMLPISAGEIIIKDIGGAGSNVVCARSFEKK